MLYGYRDALPALDFIHMREINFYLVYMTVIWGFFLSQLNLTLTHRPHPGYLNLNVISGRPVGSVG